MSSRKEDWKSALKLREEEAVKLTHYGWPLSDSPRAIYATLEKYEQSLMCPHKSMHDYVVGTAAAPDEIGIFEGNGSWIVTTEHATAQQRLYPGERDRRRKDPEYGIAAIGQYLHADVGATHLTMLGRQEHDANNDAHHPFKDELGRQIARTSNTSLRGTISLHGMTALKVDWPEASRSYDVAVGIGDNPSPATQRAANLLVNIAEELGLRAGINVPFIVFTNDGPAVDANGDHQSVSFNAVGNTTRSFAESAMKENDQLAAIQIEFSSSLRWMPVEEEVRVGSAKHVGSALGYLLLKNLLERA